MQRFGLRGGLTRIIPRRDGALFHEVGSSRLREWGDSTRPPIRFEFQVYFRVVIVFRGAGVLRRTLGGG